MSFMENEKNELKKKTIKTLKGKDAFKKEISGRFSQTECDKVWRDAHKRLYKMYADHPDLPKGVASRIKFFGVTVLCEVLRGSESKRLSENNLNKIPEYGAYRSYSVDEVRTIVEWMIAEHYILQTKGKYSVLHSTYEGLHCSETITEGKLKNLLKRLKGVD